MSPATKPPRLITLILLTATSVLTMNMIVPSLGNIARDLDAEYAVISLALGGYLAVTAFVQLGAGPLADRVGRRPVILGAILLFSLASVGCALARDATTFLAFRMVQAAIISGSILSQAIVRDTTEGPAANRRLAQIAMAMALAPLLGPVVGSLLDTAFGWRASFGLYTLVGLALLALCWADLGETRPAAPAPGETRPSAPLGGLLRDGLFWSYAFCTAFSAGGFFVFLAGAPLVATQVFGISVAALGMFVGSITLGFMAGTFLSARAAGRLRTTSVIIAGRVAVCAGMALGLAIEALGMTTALLYFGCTIFVGFGNGLTTPNSNAGVLSVNPRLAGSAAGITGALSVGSGAALTTATGWLVTRFPVSNTLLYVLLAVALAGLIAALSARRLEAARQGRA